MSTQTASPCWNEPGYFWRVGGHRDSSQTIQLYIRILLTGVKGPVYTAYCNTETARIGLKIYVLDTVVTE